MRKSLFSMLGFSTRMDDLNRAAERAGSVRAGCKTSVVPLLSFVFAAAFVWNAARASDPSHCALARQSGTPQIPGLTIVYLSPLGDPTAANRWENIIIHQMEGPAGAAKNGAQAQAKDPTRRGVTLWVETDGIVYWAVPETAIPTHGDGANRNDNKYLANLATYRRVLKENSLGDRVRRKFSGCAQARHARTDRGAAEAAAVPAGALSYSAGKNLRAQLDRLQRSPLL